MEKYIWIIPQGYPDDYKANLTPFIKEQVVILKDRGYKPIVLYTRLLPLKNLLSKKPKNKIDISENGIIFYTKNLRLIKGCSRLNSFRYQTKLRLMAERCLKKYGKPSCIISHFSQYSGYAAAHLAAQYEIPLINVEHAGWLLKEKLGNYETKKLKYTYDKSSFFICVSNALKESIKNKVCEPETENKIKVIPNMIEDRFIYSEKNNNNSFVFFAAGNLYPGKRIPLLIQAFCKAFTIDENVLLVIAGEGKEKELVLKLIEENGRGNQIVLLGAITKEEMYKQYVLCDCFVLPSEHETFGIVYREALATGRPIITTAHQGFQGDLWDERFGIRIPIDDSNALITALIKMKNNSSDYDGKEISQICREKYASKNIMDKYCSIIESF